METHKTARTPAYQTFVKAYHIIIYNGAAFAALSVFYLCFYYALVVQTAIISFMTFGAMAAVITDFYMSVVHSNTALMTISFAFMAADTAGRAPENVFKIFQKDPVLFRGFHLVSLFGLFNLKYINLPTEKDFIR